MFDKPKLLTYKEFATRLHEKLVEYNYTFGKYRNMVLDTFADSVSKNSMN